MDGPNVACLQYNDNADGETKTAKENCVYGQSIDLRRTICVAIQPLNWHGPACVTTAAQPLSATVMPWERSSEWDTKKCWIT